MKKFFMSLMSLLLIAGCIYETEDPTPNGSDSTVVAQFIADISDVPTRATDSKWEAGDKVGIFMVAHGTKHIVDTVINKLYEPDPAGSSFELMPADGLEIYLPANGDVVDFIAYYPYRSTITTFPSNYKVDVSGNQQGRLTHLDLLYANTVENKTDGYDYTTPMIRFTFSHKLTKLGMNIIVNDVPLDEGSLKVYLSGAKTQHNFDLATGEFIGGATFETEGIADTIIPHQVVDGNNSGAASFVTESPTLRFEAIVVPQAAGADRKIIFVWTENGKIVRRSVDLPPTQKWDPGVRYEYFIELSKTEIAIGNNAMNQWTTGDEIRICSVIYDANDESSNTFTIPRFTDNPYPLDSFHFQTSPNLNFLGWTKDKAGEGKLYHPGEEFTFSENTTFYAQWSEKYTLYVHRDGHDAASSSNTPPQTVIEAIAPLKTVAEANRRIRNLNVPDGVVPSILIWGEVEEDVTFSNFLQKKIRLRGKDGRLKALSTSIAIHNSVVSLEDGLTLTNVGRFKVEEGAFSVVEIRQGGTLELSGSGVIAGCGYVANGQDATVGGGSVHVANGGTFTMSGGRVEWNQFGEAETDAGAANFGGGVYVAGGGRFIMSGGTINSKAQFLGGGVFVYTGGTFNKTGGTINATALKHPETNVAAIYVGDYEGYACSAAGEESDYLYYPFTQGDGSPEANGWVLSFYD